MDAILKPVKCFVNRKFSYFFANFFLEVKIIIHVCVYAKELRVCYQSYMINI